jgi:DNA polymerase-3 subunit epsilon
VCALDEALGLCLNPYTSPFTIVIAPPEKQNKKISEKDFDFEIPDFKFACSIAMARRAFPGKPSYSLEFLCNSLDIEYGNHDAGADSKSCAELTIKIFREKGIDLSMNIDSQDKLRELESLLQIHFGSLSKEGFTNSVCQKIHTYQYRHRQNIIGNIEKNNPDSLFYQKSVVFTGTLSSMTRNEAMQKIADIGGYPSDRGVTTTTNILVVGQQDFRIVGEEGLSGKQKKAF